MKNAPRFRFDFARGKPLSDGMLRLVAAGIAVAVLTLLFRSVSYRDFRRENRQNNQPGVTLLNPESWSAEQQLVFRRWMRIHEPTALIGINTQEGFLGLLPRTEKFRKRELRTVAPVPAPSPSELQIRPLVFREPVDFSGGEPVPVSLPPPAPLRVRVTDENGREIPVGDLFKGNVSASGVTLLSFFTRNGIPSGRVVLSCGDSRLDRLAETALAPLRAEKDGMVAVFWPSPEGRKK